MKFTHFILLFILINTGLYSQHNYYFIPHEANTLKLSKKNDLMLAGGIMKSSQNREYYEINGIDFLYLKIKKKAYNFQIAYSPIKHLGIFVAHSDLKFYETLNPSAFFNKSRNTSFGLGSYYSFPFPQRPLNKLKEGQKAKFDTVLFDVYAGYSLGKLQNQYYFNIANNEFDFAKYYGQIGIHWDNSVISFSYVFKKGIANYYSGIVNGGTANHDMFIQQLIFKNKISFQESTFKFDIQKHGIKYYLQITVANTSELRYYVEVYPLSHVGIVLDIQKIRQSLINRKKTKREKQTSTFDKMQLYSFF